MEHTIEKLKEIVQDVNFEVTDLGEGRVRVKSEAMRFDFEFDTLKEAFDFVTDIN